MRIIDWSSDLCSSDLRFDLSRKSLLCSAALSASLLSACDSASESDERSSNADTAVAPAMPADEPIAIDAAPVLPDHNYDEKRGWTYYYVAAIPEEDRTKGRAAGAVVANQYLGERESVGSGRSGSVRVVLGGGG